MKKYIYSLLIGGLILSLSACSEDWEDATSKHVYGQNENPYLRADAKATVTEKMKFGAGQTHTIHLEDYADVFKKQLDMTVDETLAGLSSGKVVFHNINTSRNAWDRTAPNKGTTGWYFDAVGAVADQAKAQFAVELNAGNKTLVVSALENAAMGASVGLNVGFAIDGPNFDQYVRFFSDIVIVDTPVEVSIRIPDGEYNSAPVDFNDYASAIQERFGLSVADFCTALGGDKIHMYSVGVESLKWDESSGYTANAPGYWMKADGTVTNWGADGYCLYAECNVNAGIMYVGRSYLPAKGDKYTISIGFRDKADTSKLLRFVISITMD